MGFTLNSFVVAIIVLGFEIKQYCDAATQQHNFRYLNLLKTDVTNSSIVDAIQAVRSLVDCVVWCDDRSGESLYFAARDGHGICYCNRYMDINLSTSHSPDAGALLYASLVDMSNGDRITENTATTTLSTSSTVTSTSSTVTPTPSTSSTVTSTPSTSSSVTPTPSTSSTVTPTPSTSSTVTSTPSTSSSVTPTPSTSRTVTPTPFTSTSTAPLISDCQDYAISPGGRFGLLAGGLYYVAYCIYGWTVFQRRIDGSEQFFSNWTMYEDGFGDANAEHWLGLKLLHLLTKDRHCSLKVELGTVTSAHVATYGMFNVSSDTDGYRLFVGDYFPNSTLFNSLIYQSGIKFSTYDQDNDECAGCNCANDCKGAWWYNACTHTNLNGLYYADETGNPYLLGIVWLDHTRSFDPDFSFRSSQMSFKCQP